MNSIPAWFDQHSAGVTVLLALTALLASVIQFLIIKWTEFTQRQFERYHQLIKWIAEGDNPTGPVYANRQAAAVFELRHFPRYFSVSKRILANISNLWGDKLKDPGKASLSSEISETLVYLKRRQASLFHRMWYG